MGLVAMSVGAVVAMAVTAATTVGQADRRQPAAVAVAVTTTSSTTTVVALPEPPILEEPTVSTMPPAPEPPVEVSLEGVVPAVRRGVAVLDRRTGREVFAEQPDQPFPAASVIKLLIALDALERHAASPSAVADMLSTSDDDIANRLWRQAIPRTWAARLGLAGLTPAPDPNKWGDTLMTAHDVIAIYQHVLDSPQADVIIDALAAATPLGADGFDQTFGIPDAVEDHRWAVKQGWACCYGGLRALNTTGLVDDRYVVAVLTEQPRSTGYAEAGKAVTALVAALTPLFDPV
ncbi:class A beta-lactamase-related serine hydrolase [Saccharothrix obliqua]|uniref:class A beta-lactamase-related serine hydrolase n=1 Tax=Saccharothrix obliqua TaxID=2861747 RepID=UPI001C5EECD5|nr:class A beta-lactamase-related serine hydrolase [Saccharothrix obliqua]MBW4718600.1 class A beta-lactamase-related serine hydrolase [Saccharothrix obliqua]